MDYPIHTDTISMEKSIMYFKGLLVTISIKMIYLCPWSLFFSWQTVKTWMHQIKAQQFYNDLVLYQQC